ncbi:MAG: AAA family ATPase [Candidatus Gracilibacteria bacterium]|nr:AAA family ATPase [Candidatus Gracilibacteria bacterium]
MYLSNIKLWNFRKYGSNIDLHLTNPDFLDNPNLDLNFTKGLNVLIGANDSGKTAILDAIKLVLKTNSYEWIRVQDDDFYDKSFKFRIELTFRDLEINFSRFFIEHLSIEGEGTDAKEVLNLVYEVSRNKDRIFPSDVKAGINGELGVLSAEQRELLNVTYLKPLRDVKTEFIPKKGSRLSNILDGDIAFKDKQTHLLMNIFKDFNKSIEKYFEGFENDGTTSLPDQKGKELKNKIDNFVGEFIDKDTLTEIGVSKGELKNILEKLELGLEGKINPGLGSLNRLFIASELLHLQRDNYDGLELGLIEEIEAHIHPQAQMKVIESLQKKVDEKGIQLILTTHSPNLVSKVKLENLIICNEFEKEGIKYPSAFPMGKDYTKLNKDDYKFLEIFLDTTKSNLFFANGVILVEGWAEDILIPSFAKLLKKLGIIEKDLTEAGVSVVNIGSTAFNRFSKIFHRKYSQKFSSTTYNVSKKEGNFVILKNSDEQLVEESSIIDPNIISFISNSKDIYKELSIPVSIITDIDIKPDLEPADLNIKVEEKEKSYSEQNVKCFVSPHWTLEYCLLLKKGTTSTGKFREIVYKALKENRPDALSEEFSTYIAGKNDVDFSKKLMEDHITCKSCKGIKSGLALSLANMLDNNSTLTREDIENELSLQYLINAIKYATNQ